MWLQYAKHYSNTYIYFDISTSSYKNPEVGIIPTPLPFYRWGTESLTIVNSEQIQVASPKCCILG
jgi:hypothetical protein